MRSLIIIEEHELLEVTGGGGGKRRRKRHRKKKNKNKCCPRVKDNDYQKVKIIGGTYYGSVMLIMNDNDGRGQGNFAMG